MAASNTMTAIRGMMWPIVAIFIIGAMIAGKIEIRFGDQE